MNKDTVEWLLGPQLIGVLFIIIGYLQKNYPPKQINRFYGYRTPASIQNQQTWNEANRYSAEYMMKCGVVLLIGGLFISGLLYFITMPDKIRFVILFLCILGSSIGSAIGVMVSTEKHLEKNFGKQG